MLHELEAAHAQAAAVAGKLALALAQRKIGRVALKELAVKLHEAAHTLEGLAALGAGVS